MQHLDKPIAIIGYSGHGYVVIDIFEQSGAGVTAYCDGEEKLQNPYGLQYLGKESDAVSELRGYDYFISIGHNGIREKIYLQMNELLGRSPVNAIHPSAVLAGKFSIGNGVMIAANATVNSLAVLGNGVVCNTGSVIEHECQVGDFVHIAPGAVLCGNVKVGKSSFIGANSVIKQGISIGKNVVIGAGSVVIKDIPDDTTVMGNPAREVSGAV